MANRVAWLSKRVKIGGQWFVRKPIVKATGFVTEKVEHNGHSVHAPGSFVLEWYEAGKRQRKPLTESTSEAQDALRKKLQTLEARAHGLTVVEDKGAKGKVSLEAAVREYLEEVKLNLAHKTHLAYKRALGMLVSANPGCDFVQDLERRNLMVNFIRAMKEAGLGDRTQNNLFGAIVTFLHARFQRRLRRTHQGTPRNQTAVIAVSHEPSNRVACTERHCKKPRRMPGTTLHVGWRFSPGRAVPSSAGQLPLSAQGLHQVAESPPWGGLHRDICLEHRHRAERRQRCPR